MKRIYYASGSLLSGDRVAEAVVNYAAALAVRDMSATIDIPVKLDTGQWVRAQLRIGPDSELVVVPDPTVDDDPHDDGTIAHIDERTSRLSVARAQAVDDADNTAYGTNYD